VDRDDTALEDKRSKQKRAEFSENPSAGRIQVTLPFAVILYAAASPDYSLSSSH
jgi:hypothetical protein